jgi:type IV pilus assembly protein PilV
LQRPIPENVNQENIMVIHKQKSSLLKLARQGLSAQRGVVLLESLVAILLFSMGVLALVGLQAAMIKNTTDSKFRAEACFIAQQRLGVMWSDPTNAVAYLEANTDISSLLPNGTRTVTQPSLGHFVITVTWQQPGQAQHNYTTTGDIAGG